MRKYLLFALCAVVVLGTVFAMGTPSAHAIKQFKDQFEAKYVKADSDDPKDKAFAAAVAEAKCNVCHVGKSKKDRNAYGTQLSELLDKKEDKENVAKIQESLDKVAQMNSDPKNENSPKFAELIAKGKLPGGEPK